MSLTAQVHTLDELKLHSSGKITGMGRMHIYGNEVLYILNKNGVNISKAWGGNGNLTVEGSFYLAPQSQITSTGRMHISGGERLFLLNKNGVIISKARGGNGNLKVEGEVVATKVRVKNNVWADYVFKKDYYLPTLEEVAQHIKINGHLKGIPSAAQVKKEGIELGEMNAKLLAKIEELTLYVLQQQKEIQQLKQIIKAN